VGIGKLFFKMSRHEKSYLILASLFVASLVVCNLIAQKFVEVDWGMGPVLLSVGALPYPITFLVTDLLSEIHGRKKANHVVWAGFVALAFVMGVLWLGSIFPAASDSPLDSTTYDAAFQGTWRVILASMIAYLCAQFVDIRLFHFWKKITHGRHLWLRNNASTVFSQFLDSALVVAVIFGGDKPLEWIMPTICGLWGFKALVALADTPLLYLGTWAHRKWAPPNEN